MPDTISIYPHISLPFLLTLDFAPANAVRVVAKLLERNGGIVYRRFFSYRQKSAWE
jgi:hypothetical protein